MKKIKTLRGGENGIEKVRTGTYTSLECSEKKGGENVSDK